MGGSRFPESDHRGPLPRRGPDICFMVDNLVHAISKLRCVQFHVVVKSSSYTLKSTVHGASIEVKDNGKLLNRQSRNVFAVAYGRWSFTSGSLRVVIKWLKSFPSMIILLTGYFSLAFHRLFLTAVVFTLCGDPLPKGFSYLQG